MAELRPLQDSAGKERPRGLAKGLFQVPPSFFEPLPEEVVDGFHGESG